MAAITRIGTYLPPWGIDRERHVGDDEDAITLAVAAGIAAFGDSAPEDVRAVVLVTRDLPLLDGDTGASLLAGLGLPDDVPVRETVGGAPAVLDAVTSADDGTLVIGVDVSPCSGAGALLIGPGGASLCHRARIVRSLPVTARDAHGGSSDYADPRLLRELGVNESLARLGHPAPLAAPGLGVRDARAVCAEDPIPLPTSGASAVGFALASLAEQGVAGPVLAVEQATATLAELSTGDVSVTRDEPDARPLPTGALTPGSTVTISLAAYERAFDAKLRLAAARCTQCGTLSYPPRYRCLECGAEERTELVPLPRRGEVYTAATIRVPVPGLVSPYTVAIVELGDTGVRTLARLTGAEPGSVQIGDRGTLVLRLVAVRQGVPDYGYAFLPDRGVAEHEEVA